MFNQQRRNWHSIPFVTFLAAFALLVTAGVSLQTRPARAQTVFVPETRDLLQMPAPQLRALRDRLQAVISNPATPAEQRYDAQAKLRQVQAIVGSGNPAQNQPVKRKKPGANKQSVLDDRRPPSALSTPQLRQRLRRLELIIDARGVKKRAKRRAKAMRAAAQAELARRAGGGPKTRPNPPLYAVLQDRRPPRRLTDTQLLNRLARLERIIDGHGIAKSIKAKARAFRRRDRAELDRRRGGGVQPPIFVPPVEQVDTRVLDDRRPPHLLSDPELNARLRRLERIIDGRGVPQHLKARARQMRFGARAEVQRRRAANAGPPVDARVLDDLRPARSLSNRDLRIRLDRADRLAKNRRARPQTRRAAQRMYRIDLAEWNRRQQVNRPPQNNALAVLTDRRPARTLSTPQLRRRVALLRAALRQPGLTGTERRQLTRRLTVDRTVLRQRVARQINPPSNVNPGPPASNRGDLTATARRLLRDYRQSRVLNNAQLRRRIKDARQVLLYEPLQAFERRRIADLIRSDRAEKRRRLLDARKRRQNELARLRARGRLQYRTPPPAYVPRGDLNAAEFDRDAITRKFLAPPPPATRRYTLNELRRSPQLTRRYPGVDLDTINFGFNESFIREEEVDELERMALAIERILAVRPYEIFQIAGHTDAVGSDHYNKVLSEQRARAVRDALVQFFVIPRRNLVTVGFGEAYLKIPTEGPEAENRRVTIRRITPLVR